MAGQTSDSLLARVFDGSPVGMAVYDSSGRCLSVNESAQRLVGGSRDELLPQDFRSHGAWERTGLLQDAEWTLSTGEATQRSVPLRTESGLAAGKDIRLTYRFSRFDSEDGSGEGSLDDSRVSPVDSQNGPGERRHLLLVISDDSEALAESERRYASLFNDSHAVQLIIDPDDGAIVDVNPAACSFYGRSRDAFLRMKITDVNVLSAQEVRSEMAAALAELRDHFHFRHRLATGEIRDVEVYSSPAVINGRKLLYSIVHDVTARRRAEDAVRQLAEESSLLLEATEVVTASLHLDEMLSRLASVAAGLVGARRCTISLQGEDGLWRDAASTDKHLPMPGEPFDPALPSMETVLFVEDVGHVGDIGFSSHPGMLSALIAPFSRAGVSGWLCFDDPGWSTDFSAEQRRLAAAIAKQAALALANSQAFETQLSIAAVLQRNLMPRPVDDMCGLEIAYRYVSATKGALVGGDFLDYMALDDHRVLLFLGDVSGHGLEATLHTAMAKYAVKALASIDSRPSVLLSAVNRAIAGQMGHGQFITMTMVLIDTERMHACAASAGHPSPLVLRGTGSEPSIVQLTEDAQNGPPLGALESSEYVEVCTALSYGDKVVAFTDGATEARSAADRTRMFGGHGVQSAVLESAGGSALATASGLLASVEKFAGGALTDDLAIVTARLLPGRGSRDTD